MSEPKYPPERAGELPYVQRYEDDEPCEEWGLRSEFTEPWFVDVSDVEFGVNWTFGPQGHPGSLHIYFDMFNTEGYKPTLHVLGPDVAGNNRTKFQGAFPSAPYLKALLIYGHQLQERFGTDPYWHQCREGCFGHLPTTKEGPPYRRCPDCMAVSARAQEEVNEWVKAHPFPELTKPLTEDAR